MVGALPRALDHHITTRMRRIVLLLTLLGAAIGLGLVGEYFALGSAAAVQTLFYLALLGFVIGVVRLLVPPRSREPARAGRKHATRLPGSAE